MPGIEHLLVHRVTRTRRSGRRDRFHQKVDVNPQSPQTGATAEYPCRAYQKSGGMVMQERSVDVFERYWIMYTALDADILEDDSVTITDPKTGRMVLAKAKIASSEVKHDMNGPHHLEFTLWNQGGPDS